MSNPSGNLLHNLVLFGRLLRALGMDVNPGRVIDLVQALQYIEIGNRDDFYHTVRSLLVHERDDLPLFDQAFRLFWRAPAEQYIELPYFSIFQQARPPRVIKLPPPLLEQSRNGENQNEGEGEVELDVIEVTRTYSHHETLRQKDFSELTAEEFAAVKCFIDAMVWQLGERQTRRQQSGRGSRLDLRRSLRRNLRYGGEMLEWPTRRPKTKQRPLVVIADISGSMERYTRLLLHFIYSLAGGAERPVEAFVFSTRLTRITRQIRQRNIEHALRDVSKAVTDWSGGTRIGEALKSFNYDWARRVLGGGAIVLIISDGWDRGDVDLLKTEICRLQRSYHRLIWLNPLLGSPRYEPLTRGIQACLPHIDDFLPVHNLASLEDLGVHLAQLSAGKRPSRGWQTSTAAFIRQP
jgi:uncharacterized protein with von Willebrand factor type A (vWA) domain